MAHFPSRFVSRSQSMTLVSLHPSAPVQQAHRQMEIAAANILLHCSSPIMMRMERLHAFFFGSLLPATDERAEEK